MPSHKHWVLTRGSTVTENVSSPRMGRQTEQTQVCCLRAWRPLPHMTLLLGWSEKEWRPVGCPSLAVRKVERVWEHVGKALVR